MNTRGTITALGRIKSSHSISIPGWALSVQYEIGDYINENNTLYRCISSHTSVDFSAETIRWEATTSVLATINEGNGVGIRIATSLATSHGPIGLRAVDLSYSNSSSALRGSRGTDSFTTGKNNENGYTTSIMFGQDNTDIQSAGSLSAANLLGGAENVYGNHIIGSAIFGERSQISRPNISYTSQCVFLSLMSGGKHDFYAGHGSSLIGNLLIGGAANSTVVGLANVDETVTLAGHAGIAIKSQDNPRFTVGCGTFSGSYTSPGTITRQNGFVVWGDGNVKFPMLSNVMIDAANDDSAVTKGWVVANAGAGSANVFVELTENSQTGFAIYDRNSDRYGNIGEDAVDFSVSLNTSSTRGSRATKSLTIGLNNENVSSNGIVFGTSITMTDAVNNGQNSLIGGEQNTVHNNVWNSILTGNHNVYGTSGSTYATAILYESAVVGRHNNIYAGHSSSAHGAGLLGGSPAAHIVGVANADLTTQISNYYTANFNAYGPRFIVGCGVMNSDSGAITSRSNGFVVMSNGTVTFPMLTDGLIDAAGNTSAVTKGWVIANSAGGAMEAIDEGNGVGIVISGRSAANYGNVGLQSFDASYSSSGSSVKGASGLRSFAANFNTRASGETAAAFGYGSNATGDYSMACNASTASGLTSFAAGTSTASASRAFAVGNTCVSSGDQAFSGGYASTASAYASVAIGRGVFARQAGEFSGGAWGTDDTGRIMNIGNGTGSGARADAMTIYLTGDITFHQLTEDLIDDADDFSAVTKGWVLSNMPAGGGTPDLQSVTDQGNSTSNNIDALSFNDMKIDGSSGRIRIGNTGASVSATAIIIGTEAGYNASHYSVVLGYHAAASQVSSTASSLIAIGSLAAHSLPGNDCIAIGGNALQHNTVSLGANPAELIAIGSYAMQNAGGKYNIAIGRNAMETANTVEVPDSGGAFPEYNIGIGAYAGQNNQGQYNIMMGRHTADENVGSYNVMLGASSTGSNNTGDNNFIGLSGAGSHNMGDNNMMIGNSAGSNNHGDYNVLFGRLAGASNGGSRNVFIGDNAGSDFIASPTIDFSVATNAADYVNNRITITAHGLDMWTDGNMDTLLEHSLAYYDLEDSGSPIEGLGGGYGGFTTYIVIDVNTLELVNRTLVDYGTAGNGPHRFVAQDDTISDSVALGSGAQVTKPHQVVLGNDQLTEVLTSGQYNIKSLHTAPATATDTGTLGEIRVTATHIYVCTATDTWKRTALATW